MAHSPRFRIARLILAGALVPAFALPLAYAQQTASPPAQQAQSAQTQTATPAVPAGQPAVRQQLPEQRAFDEAGKIADPVAKLEAYRKIIADYPTSNFLRMVENSILNTLMDLPDRAAELGPAFQKIVANVPPGSPPESRLSIIQTPVSRLLERNIVLPEAEAALTEALAAFDFEAFARAQRETASRAKRPEPTTEALRARYNISKAAGLEVAARLHKAMGDLDRALQEFKDALALSPYLTVAPVELARIEVQRGNLQAALDYYLTAAAGGKLVKKADEEEFRALYRKVRGSDAGLEDDLDRVFLATFPNPVHPEKWTPSASRTNRIVLAELFTGSGCGPCVSADYALEAVLERYPASAVATLVYHVHVPAPDPMTTPGSTDRKSYYEVKGVPTFNVAGALSRLGGGNRENTEATFAEYIKSIDTALDTPPLAALEIRAARTGNSVTVSAAVSALASDAKDVRLHIALAEPVLRFNGENGMRFHPLVVRALAGSGVAEAAVETSPDKAAPFKSAYGLPVAVDAQGRAAIEYTFDLARIPAEITRSLDDEIAKRRKTAGAGAATREFRAEGHAMTTVDPDSLVVVAFLQDAKKRVLQAARVELTPARR